MPQAFWDYEKLMSELFPASSYWKLRAEAMGFEFGPPRIMERAGAIPGLRAELDFWCVCGKAEMFTQFFLKEQIDQRGSMPDSYEVLTNKHQAFSRSHLIDDGFAPNVVEDILAKGRAFDQQQGRTLAEMPPIAPFRMWYNGAASNPAEHP